MKRGVAALVNKICGGVSESAWNFGDAAESEVLGRYRDSFAWPITAKGSCNQLNLMYIFRKMEIQMRSAFERSTIEHKIGRMLIK